MTHPERIFVSVATYRDEEAQWTVNDLFCQAAAPERVRIGIVWQARMVPHGRRPRDETFPLLMHCSFLIRCYLHYRHKSF